MPQNANDKRDNETATAEVATTKETPTEESATTNQTTTTTMEEEWQRK